MSDEKELVDATNLLKVLKNVGVQSTPEALQQLLDRVKELQAKSNAEMNPAIARWQDQVIARLIEPGSTVLDVGCGEGDLLIRLFEERQAAVQGVEINQEHVIRCIERGVPIYHSDLANGLHSFQDGSFDYVILENTIQTLKKPMDVLKEMLRIGKHCVISFPNFAHWLVRLFFSLGGRMPVTPSLPNTWYDTPNIHLCSIEDFLTWCHKDKVCIEVSWVLVQGKVLEYMPEHNLTAEEAVFLVKKA